eukprot:358162-Chlamydomonas_euryale.AAC.13
MKPGESRSTPQRTSSGCMGVAFRRKPADETRGKPLNASADLPEGSSLSANGGMNRAVPQTQGMRGVGDALCGKLRCLRP